MTIRTKHNPIKHQSTIASIILLIGIICTIGITYSYVTTPDTFEYESEDGGYLVYQIMPRFLIADANTIHFQWDTQGIVRADFNESGVIGKDSRTKDVRLCEWDSAVPFSVEFETGEVVEYPFSSTLYWDPVFIILTAIIILLSTILLYINQLLTWERVTVFILILSSSALLVLLYNPICENNSLISQFSEYVAHVSVYILSVGIYSAVAIATIVARKYLVKILELVRFYIPFPVFFATVVVNWVMLGSLGVYQFANMPWLLGIYLLAIVCPAICLLAIYSSNFSQKPTRSYTLNIITKRTHILVALFVWLLLYNFDWVRYLGNVHVQAVVGFSLYVMSGTVMYHALFDYKSNLDSLLLGFVWATLVSMVLILIGLVLGLSSSIVILAYSIIGAVALTKLLSEKPNINITLVSRPELLSTIVMASLVAMVTLLTILNYSYNANQMTATDNYTYYALVSHYDETEQYNLNDFILGTDFQIVLRLMWRFWTGSLSIIVNLAGTTILNIDFMLQVLLILMIICSMYYLSRDLDLPNLFAPLSIIVYLSFLSLQLDLEASVGTYFYSQLIQDKQLVIFLLAPILFVKLINYFKSDNKSLLYQAIIIIITISLIHPTSLAIVSMWVILYMGLEWLSRRKHMLSMFVVFMAFVLGMLPSIAILQMDPLQYPFESSETFTEDYDSPSFQDRILLDDSFQLLGVHPGHRTGLAYQALTVAAIISVLLFWKSDIAKFILASAIAVLLVSNPLTAPIIAKVITVVHVHRVLWVAPFGLAFVFIIAILSGRILKLSSQFQNFIAIIFAIIFVGTMFYNMYNYEPKFVLFSRFANHLETPQWGVRGAMVNFGVWLNSERPIPDVVLADDVIQNFIPVIAEQTYPVYFRRNVNQTTMRDEDYFKRVSQTRNRMKELYRQQLKPEQFSSYISMYQVSLIVVDQNKLNFDFDEYMQSLDLPFTFQLIHTIRNIDIYEVIEK